MSIERKIIMREEDRKCYQFNEILHLRSTRPFQVERDEYYKAASLYEPESVLMGHTALAYHAMRLQCMTIVYAYSHKYNGLQEYHPDCYINFIPFPKRMKSISFKEQGIIWCDKQKLFVTDRERTLTDMWQIQEYSGDPDEIITVTEEVIMHEKYQEQALMKYLDLWDDPTLNKRIHFYLEFDKTYFNPSLELIQFLEKTETQGIIELMLRKNTLYDERMKVWYPDLASWKDIGYYGEE